MNDSHFSLKQILQRLLTTVHDVITWLISGLKVSGYRLKQNENILICMKWKDNYLYSTWPFSFVIWFSYWIAGEYSCRNTECLFFKQLKNINSLNFRKNGTCNYWSAAGDYIDCSARKYCTFLGKKEAHAYPIWYTYMYYQKLKQVFK